MKRVERQTESQGERGRGAGDMVKGMGTGVKTEPGPGWEVDGD